MLTEEPLQEHFLVEINSNFFKRQFLIKKISALFFHCFLILMTKFITAIETLVAK